MKKILLSMAALLVLGSSVSVDAQRHRHTPRTENVVSASSAKKDDASKSSSASKSKDEGIEAFSDTSSVDTSSSVVYNGNGAMNDSDSDTYPFAMFENIFASKFWGTTIFVIIILLGITISLMPLIIVVLLIRFLVKRHNDHMRLAEKAMESGQPISDEQMPLSKKSPDYMWRRGIRNVSIGIGLMLFFWFLGAEPLVGIGGLVACLGAGQMFMVRYNYNNKFGRRKFDDDELNKL
ncbi:DUF6249 domain-containing protein [Prevotella sp.]|uniref:DUF6249 domain-containing protein n=1 Tax=Prevotella sp. TaxID=59823 RepID=UPI0040260320